jgi:aspartyl aminopeptidase
LADDRMNTLDDLLAFLSASPTPYHAVASAAARLEAADFHPIAERDPWEELGPGRYYVVQEGSALVAFVVPTCPIRGFRIVGAHTDSPNLRLKPKPEYTKEGYLQLGVEVYGGALLNSWLDRDLGLAGRALVRSGESTLETRLVRMDRPRLRVPQLAIHLDRDVNDKGLVLNKQEHLAPVLGLRSSGEADVKALVADAVGVSAADIVHLDLMLYDTLDAARGGAHDEVFFSARLDNLAMCHAAVQAMTRAAQPAASGSLSPVIALFDHEEVGSQSVTGAESNFLPRVLERLSRRGGRSFDEHARVLASSLCLSADMAHAVHPNYESRHEPRHKPVLNGGPVLKVNSQQRYATSARTGTLVEELCRKLQVPLQHYVNRTDLPCGTTIGPITSTLLGVPTADVGNPMLSMHSCREMAGADDPAMMERLMAGFLAVEG